MGNNSLQPSKSHASGSDENNLSMLGHLLSVLSRARDLHDTLETFAYAFLRLTGAAAVEVYLTYREDGGSAPAIALRRNGAHHPFLSGVDPGAVIQRTLSRQQPQLEPLSAEGGVAYVLAYPLAPSGQGVVVLGYQDEPVISSDMNHMLRALALNTSLLIDRLQWQRDAQREVAHRDLISEISQISVAEGTSEYLFHQAVQRIRAAFGLSTAAVYAGHPLSLRLQEGGIPTEPGARVERGLARQALQERRPLVSGDIQRDPRCAVLPWIAEGARSEIALPIEIRDKRIGVLDLYSPRRRAFDEKDLKTLATVSRQLALIIARETSDKSEDRAQQLEEAYARLQDFSELKGQILQNISHELRTPLTVIKGYLELLIEEAIGPLQPVQRQTLETMLHKADEVVRIVDHIVALSPLNRFSLEHQRVPVKPLLEKVGELFADRIEGTGISIVMGSIAPDLALHGDPEKIRQVCYNILDNSIKFSPDGGRVTIEATQEDAYVHLLFHDEGIGMPKRRLSQIFDTFYQIDGSSTRRFGGLGLGLTVVNRVVAAHEGKVWAESEVDQGSTFHVLLPRYMTHRQILDTVVGDLS